MTKALAIESCVQDLRASLAVHGTPARASREKRYLKSELSFLGVPQPIIRREAKAFVRAHPELDRAALHKLAQALWATRVHELRSVAIGILEQRLSLLSARDARWLIGLVRDSHTWAYVDWLAIKIIGPLVTNEPSARKQLDVWARDKDFWVRRTALLAFHDPLIRGEGDFAHFARLAVPMLHEKEFFIRKAIGWVLRSTARKTPERTEGFVREHARELAGLSFKEATRNLPLAQQEKLNALRGK